jgi:DNA-binding NarL/FixJ family response regulator
VKTSFLLISDRGESAWANALRETLLHLGSLEIISEEKTNFRIFNAQYDLIIIDASAVKKPAHLVTQLLNQKPEVRVVVATITPTWQEARTVLLAGAADYFRQSLNKEELVVTIKTILDRCFYQIKQK